MHVLCRGAKFCTTVTCSNVKTGNVPNGLKGLACSGNTEIATWLLLTAYDKMHRERDKLKNEVLSPD